MSSPAKKILTIFGTRPEAIKLAPLIRAISSEGPDIQSTVCVTSQHKEMLVQVLDLLGIKPDYDLDIMQEDQDLFDITSRIMLGMRGVLEECRPDVVVVQGDTSTAFLGALAAFYLKIPVAHVEAGLRTRDKYDPFPEELNRTFISSIADFHFAPTENAKQNLINEMVPQEKIFVTGNTVIDALMLALDILKSGEHSNTWDSGLGIKDKRLILVTGHRRESFGEGFKNICTALKELAAKHPEIEIVYPVHLNPNIRREVMRVLAGIPNIHLEEPMDYAQFILLMDKCCLVLTDSGGIQEEAPSLNKPVLVMRNTTERPEAVEAGAAIIVGTDSTTIVEQTERLLNDQQAYDRMSSAANPYGDGKAALRILDVLKKNL